MSDKKIEERGEGGGGEGGGGGGGRKNASRLKRMAALFNGVLFFFFLFISQSPVPRSLRYTEQSGIRVVVGGGGGGGGGRGKKLNTEEAQAVLEEQQLEPTGKARGQRGQTSGKQQRESNWESKIETTRGKDTTCHMYDNEKKGRKGGPWLVINVMVLIKC